MLTHFMLHENSLNDAAQFIMVFVCPDVIIHKLDIENVL